MSVDANGMERKRYSFATDGHRPPLQVFALAIPNFNTAHGFDRYAYRAR
jgi:hypothetical protein